MSQIHGIITQEVNDMAKNKPRRVRVKEFALASTVAGWETKVESMVLDENWYLIGAQLGVCTPGQDVGARIAKGVSDPAVDAECDDCYFYLSGLTSLGGSSSPSFLLPQDYGFYINEDEPVFIDMFTAVIGQGGHLTIFYVKAKDW